MYLCDSCIHKKVCRFEAYDNCNNYKSMNNQIYIIPISSDINKPIKIITDDYTINSINSKDLSIEIIKKLSTTEAKNIIIDLFGTDKVAVIKEE